MNKNINLNNFIHLIEKFNITTSYNENIFIEYSLKKMTLKDKSCYYLNYLYFYFRNVPDFYKIKDRIISSYKDYIMMEENFGSIGLLYNIKSIDEYDLKVCYKPLKKLGYIKSLRVIFENYEDITIEYNNYLKGEERKRKIKKILKS